MVDFGLVIGGIGEFVLRNFIGVVWFWYFMKCDWVCVELNRNFIKSGVYGLWIVGVGVKVVC